MLTKTQLSKIREELDNSAKPFYYFDDDPDGIASFLIVYRYRKEGIGVIVKARSLLTMQFLNKAINYGADRIFVLDIPDADEEVQKLNIPMTWIDHHDTNLNMKKSISYYNPKQKKERETKEDKTKKQNKKETNQSETKQKEIYIPTSYLCYQALKTDLWIAAVGCIGDYYLPNFIGEVKEIYPELLENTDITNLDKVKYETNLGKLVKMFSFLMMGDMKNVQTNLKILTRMDDPMELINNETSRSKKLNKHFDKINNEYEKILNKALETKIENNILFFLYPSTNVSVTKDIANELSSRMRDKVIIIGREKGGELRISLRWSKDIRTPFQKVLEKIEGYGGGHENSCGGAIKSEYKKQFLELMSEEIKKIK